MVMNIWESHESSSRKAIPYCRVLSQLLKNKKVLGKSAKPAVVAATPFDKTHLPKGKFAFSETFLHYVLHDLSTQRKHLVRKPAPEEVQDGVALGEEREYEHHGSLSEAPVYPGRPPAYQHWDTYQRMTWDNTQHHWEVQRLRDEEADRRRSRFEERVEERLARFDRRITRMEQVVAVQGYFQQRYQYDLFDWTEQQRHWADYNNGREYQLHSLRQDFSSLMRTDESGSSRQPIAHPEMNHPDWWPGDYRAHPASGSSSSRDNPEVVDPFDTRDLAQALYEEFFGPNH